VTKAKVSEVHCWCPDERVLSNFYCRRALAVFLVDENSSNVSGFKNQSVDQYTGWIPNCRLVLVVFTGLQTYFPFFSEVATVSSLPAASS